VAVLYVIAGLPALSRTRRLWILSQGSLAKRQRGSPRANKMVWLVHLSRCCQQSTHSWPFLNERNLSVQTFG
jgi:hypothetical protein